jgi:hypothetical protein
MNNNEELKKAERKVMIERLLKAEEDIKEGRVYTFEEAKKNSDENLRRRWDTHLREATIASALKAEEDIKAGRIYAADEFKKIIKDCIKQKH